MIGPFAALAVALVLTSCVRRGQVCIEASPGRAAPGWVRQDSVGASACVDVEPPGSDEQE